MRVRARLRSRPATLVHATQQHRDGEDREDHTELPVRIVFPRPQLEVREDRCAAIAIQLRIRPLEVLRDHHELAARVLQRRAAFETSSDAQLAIVAILEECFLRVRREDARHRERDVEVRPAEYRHSREGVRRDANHREVGAVQANRPADDGRIAREFVLPEGGAEHDDRVAAGHRVFVIPKSAPQPRLDVEDAEVIAGHEHAALDPRRRARLGAEADRSHRRVRRHAVVASCARADVEVFAIGEIVEAVVARRAHQRDDVAWMRNGVRPEDQRVHHAERRRGHPDAEREGHDHERGQRGRPPQAPDGVARVADEIGQPLHALRVPHLVLPLRHTVHRTQRREPRVRGRQAARDALFDLVIQVELELFVELLLDPPAPQNRSQSQRHGEPPAFHPHDCYPSDSRTTCEMADESRCQFAASVCSCFLPRRVRE